MARAQYVDLQLRRWMESHLQSISESARRTVNMITNDALHVVEVPAYAALQRQIHDALRAQHPKWVQPNGDSPTCDAYESRFADLLRILPRRDPMTKNTPRFAISAVQFCAIAENLTESKHEQSSGELQHEHNA
jgi:hypothetical protein